MDLHNKKVIVTGGVQGVGYNVVTKLIAKGAIVGVLDVDGQKLGELENEHENIHCFHCDITDPVQVEETLSKFYENFQGSRN